MNVVFLFFFFLLTFTLNPSTLPRNIPTSTSQH